MDLSSYLAIGAIAMVWLAAEFIAWLRADRATQLTGRSRADRRHK